MVKTCFGLSSEHTYDENLENLVEQIGFLSYVSGTRPSALFEWNDPDQWDERLAFDLDVCKSVLKVLMELRQFP